MNSDLKLKKASKFCLRLTRNITHQKIRYNLRYKNHLSGEKWKKIISHDEAWMYLNDCNKKGNFITIKEEKIFLTFGSQNRKKISSRDLWMWLESHITIRYKYGKLKNVKIKSMCHQKYILFPIFNNEVPALCLQGHQSFELHQENENCHISKSIVEHLYKMKKKLESDLPPSVTFLPNLQFSLPWTFVDLAYSKKGIANAYPKQLFGYGKQWNI